MVILLSCEVVAVSFVVHSFPPGLLCGQIKPGTTPEEQLSDACSVRVVHWLFSDYRFNSLYKC